MRIARAISRTTSVEPGPYTVEDWKRGSTLTLARWDGYWGEPAANAEVVFHYFTDASAQSNALLTGEVDGDFRPGEWLDAVWEAVAGAFAGVRAAQGVKAAAAVVPAAPAAPLSPEAVATMVPGAN